MPKIEQMTSIPARSNPYRHDLERQGCPINERFEAMFVNYLPNELVIIDKYTGKRVKLTFPDVKSSPRPKKAVKKQSGWYV